MSQIRDDAAKNMLMRAKAIILIDFIENGDAEFLAFVVDDLMKLDTELAKRCHDQMLKEPSDKVGAKETTLRHEIILAFAGLADYVINIDVKRLDVLIDAAFPDNSKKELLN